MTKLANPAAGPTAPSRWGGLRPLIAAHPVATQLILMFGVSWPILIPVILNGLPPEPFMLLVIPLGQLLPAILVTAAQGGRPAVRAMFGRVFRWRVARRWYLLAFLLIPLTCLAVSTVYGAGNWTALFSDHRVIVGYLVSLSILPVVNLWEETAWTDVVQHNLARRRGPLLAAVITGPLFGLVHLPLRLSNGVTMDMLTSLVFAMILAIGFRFLIGWLYYSSGRSILIAAIVHATFNATNNGDLLLHAQPDSVVLQNLAFFVAAAIGLVAAIATRGRLGMRTVDGNPNPTRTLQSTPGSGLHEAAILPGSRQ